MTIRELLKAQILKVRVVAFVSWLLFAAGTFLSKDSPYKVLVAIPFLGFLGAILYMQFFVKCPKCGAKLGQVMSNMTTNNFCPSCGVSLETKV